MTTISEFSDFSKSKDISNLTAGIAVMYENSILLVHPTSASWRKSALGIPKGHVHEDEDTVEAAIREFKEETGLDIPIDKIDLDAKTIPNYDSNGNVKSMLIYYVARIDSPSELGMTSHKVDKDLLQLEEIDWAGFVPVLDAYPMIHRYQMIILDRLK